MPEQRIRLLFVCQVEEEAAERLCRVPVKNDVMKRIIFSVFILYAYVGFSSCGGLLLKTPFKKSMEETTESVSVNEQNQVNAFLQELYDKYVFWSDRVGNFEDVVEHFSPEILTKLRKAYEYEYDGSGYAVWLFRTGAQDGPEDKSKVTSILTEGDDWYTVFFSDMGIKGSCRFHAKLVDGKVFVSEFENGSMK